jgi:hypothetical protein
MANYVAIIIGERSLCLGAISEYQQNIILENVIIHQKYTEYSLPLYTFINARAANTDTTIGLRIQRSPTT